MSTRRAFLAAAASTALAGAAPPSPAPTQSPPPPKAPKVSAAARALAESMRTFDRALSSGDVETIARNIDGNLKLGAAIDPKGRALRNWDEPATVFEATE